MIDLIFSPEKFINEEKNLTHTERSLLTAFIQGMRITKTLTETKEKPPNKTA